MLQNQTGRPNLVVQPVYEEAAVLARRAGDGYTLFRIFMNTASTYAEAGDRARDRAGRLQALEAARHTGRAMDRAFASYAFAYCCLAMGGWREARAAVREAFEVDPGQLYRFLVPWLDADFDGALRILREDAAAAQRNGSIQVFVLTHALLADCALQLGRFEAALIPARQAADALRSHGCWHWTTEVYGACAEAAVRADSPDPESVLDETETATEIEDRWGARPQRAQARALWLQSRGDAVRAKAALGDSVRLARAQGASLQLGRSLAVLADVLRQSDEADSAAETDSELAALVERIGPEVRGLVWS